MSAQVAGGRVTHPLRAAVAAGIAYFGAVFALGFALGIARTLLLQPLAGETLAVALELPVMLGFAWVVCARLVRRFRVEPAAAARLVMGAGAFALLMAGELAISILLAGRSVGGHFALYRDAPHLLGLAGQLAFALFPLLQARRASGE